MYEGGSASPRYISLREAQTGYKFEATRCNDLWCGGGWVPTGALVWEIATHWLIWTICEVQGLEVIVSTSVACAAQLLPRPQLIFPSKTWFLGIYLNFQQQKSLKNQYLSYSKSKSYQINSIKYCSSRLSQQYQSPFQFLRNFQLRFNWIFSEEIIQYSRTFAPQVQTWMERSPCTAPHWELSKDTKNTIRKNPGLVDLISTKAKQNKTNYLPS